MKGRRKREETDGQEKIDKRLIAVVWLKISGPSAVLFGRHNNSGAFADFSLNTSKSFGTSFFIPHNTCFLLLYEMWFVRLQQEMNNVLTRHHVTSLQNTAAQYRSSALFLALTMRNNN
jgi:hypothetical protein